MNLPNFDNMTRDELAHFMVAYRDTETDIDARRVYIHKLKEKAKNSGIDLEQTKFQQVK